MDSASRQADHVSLRISEECESETEVRDLRWWHKCFAAKVFGSGEVSGRIVDFDVGVMTHLRVLESVGLVVTRKVGRERLHYLDPVPAGSVRTLKQAQQLQAC